MIAQQEGGLIHVSLIRMEEEYVEQLWHKQCFWRSRNVLLRSELIKNMKKNQFYQNFCL